MRIEQSGKILSMYDDGFELTIRPWGSNSLRVQMWPVSQPDDRDWALTEEVEETEPEIEIKEVFLQAPWEEEEDRVRSQTGVIRNGNISAEIGPEGWITFRKADGSVILQEYWRNRDRIDRYAVPQGIAGRQMSPVPGSYEYRLTARFEADPDEHIYGMGQYQELNLDKKGEVLDLEQRNSQITIPFYVSSLGYGFFWNNPAIGKAVFGQNRTEWTAERTKKLDYFITVGDPKQVVMQFTKSVGRSPIMPAWALGLWQSKLRYRTQAEVLEVAEEYHRRGLPLEVIVIDFFHWTKQGEFRFSPVDFPDPDAMVKRLKELGVRLMVSVWPTVDATADNHDEMMEKGYLVKNDRGLQVHMNWIGETRFLDPFSEGARTFVWDKVKQNYYDYGIRLFWLDEVEPEYGPYEFDLYRYSAGPALEVSNYYPVAYARAFYDGMRREGESEIMNLTRCAWAGSQKYGTLVWSGDVCSTFRAMRENLQAGINMGLSGIAWWISDIGGFIGGDVKSDSFKELLVRWFEWGTFCPVLRMHGERQPFKKLTMEEQYRDGVKQFSYGLPNEVWSYGEKVYDVLTKFIAIREQLRPYVEKIGAEAHETGLPLIRALFLEYPDEAAAWTTEDEYLFGPDLLVAPVTEEGLREKEVYFPGSETWVDLFDGTEYEGGTLATVPAPLDKIPAFVKKSSDFRITI